MPTPPQLAAALADRYLLERELGQGGMATVYLADDLRHQRKVALKVLRPELAATLGPERFLQEVRIAANLQHPHILAVHDSGEAAGFLYYVMPFIEGPSLRDKLAREGELPVVDAVRILRDVADALAAAHAKGVVHRDIKPENVLLSGRHAMVADFGVAKAVSEATGRQNLTTAGVALGTPTYMAPEQAAADPNVDHRADIYALGVMAYETLTGRPPFQSATPQGMLAAHVTEAPVAITTRRATLPAALSTLVMRCLEKKPADRPQSAEEVRVILESVATPSGGTTPTMTAPIRAIGLTRSHTRAAMAVVAVLVGIAIVLGVRWRLGGSSGLGGSARGGTLAVIPFENETGDTANAYLGAGLAEDLVTALGRVPGLEVKSPTAARRAMSVPGATVASVGEVLGATYVVEGSLRRLGESWRITARAVRPKDEVQVWSESFDRSPAQLVSLAPEIATRLSTALVGQLGQETRAAVAVRPTTNPEAYEAYLRGNFLVAERTRDKLERGLAEYRRALALDRSFNAARARIGFVLSLMADFGWFAADETASSIIVQGLAVVDSAIGQDSTMADSWLARCSLLWAEFGFGGNRVNQARAACERAAAMAPRNAEIQNRLGFVLRDFSDWEGATAQARLAQAIDPQWQVPHWLLVYVALETGNLAVAEAEMDTVERLAPSSIQATWVAAFRGRLQFLRGDTAAVRESIRLSRARGGEGGAVLLEGLLLAKRGRRDSAAAIASLFERNLVYREVGSFNCIYASLIWLALGDTSRAFVALERRPQLITFLRAPDLVGLRGHPRYEAILTATRHRVGR